MLPLNPIDPLNPDPTKLHMENAGFEFIQGVMTPGDPIYKDFLTKIDSLESSGIYGYNAKYDLYFGEYMYIKYLQKIHPGEKILRIRFGLFYVDNMLYIFNTDTLGLRSDIKGELIVGELNRHQLINTLRSGGTFADKMEGSTFLHLHADYSKFPFLPDAFLPGINKPFPEYLYNNTIQDFHLSSSERRFNIVIGNYDEINFIKYKLVPTLYENRDSLDYFNIWLKIDGTPQAKSLGFVDIVDPNFNKDTVLNDMLSDTENPDITRINRIKGGFYLNINKAPNKVLYTPVSMNNGDILRFDTTSTPHTALTQEDGNWRISAESRYAELKVPFILSSEYTIEGTELQINTEGNDDARRKLGTYRLIDIVDNYFRQRFRDFLQPPGIVAQDPNMDDFYRFLETIPTPW